MFTFLFGSNNIKLFLAKCTEVFGPKYGGAVLGNIALGDVLLNISLGFINDAMITGEQRDYLYFFIMVACFTGVGFIITLFMPSTPEDKIRKEKCRHGMRKLCCLFESH